MNNYSDSIDIVNKNTQNDGFSITISAPAKVILFGEHSVVYGKLAIAASLGLRTTLTFTEQEPTEIGNSQINIILNGVNLIHCYDLDDLQNSLLTKNSSIYKNIALEKPETAHHEQFVEPIEEFIKRNCGSIPLSSMQHQALLSLFYLLIVMLGPAHVSLKPFKLTIDADMTISAGLGSSASYVVVLSATFYEYLRFKTGKTKDRSITKQFSKKDLDLISKWAFSAERIMHGTPSGIDNTICTYGSLVEFRTNPSNPMVKRIEIKYQLQILLINSRLPKDTKAQVAKVAMLKQNYPTVIDSILTSMDNVATLALQHFSKLNEITSSDKICLEECQKKIAVIYGQILDLVDLNQNLLRCLRVSHPALDEICSVLKEFGLFGKLTGGGGGGYAYTIIPPAFSRNTLEKVIEKLNELNYETILTDLCGPGLSIS